MNWPKLYRLTLLFIFLEINFHAAAQSSGLPVNEWIKKLSLKKDIENKNFREIENYFMGKESIAMNAIAELERKGPSANHYFKVRLLCLKATILHRINFSAAKPMLKQLFTQALNEAYAAGDNYLIAFASWMYGALMYTYQEMELAVTYCLKAMEINDGSLNNKPFDDFAPASLGEMLFRTRDYEKSVYYTLKILNNWTDTSLFSDYFKMKSWNTAGQDYQELGKLDSALICYNKSIQLANTIVHLPYNIPPDIWKGINSGFIGQVYFLQKQYKKAKPLFEYDYNINKTFDFNIAAYSLQWLARINLIQGKKDSALLQIKEALRLLGMPTGNAFQNKSYLQKTYYAAADIFRAHGNTDSFYHYSQLYLALHDSLEKASLRSFEIARMSVDNQKSFEEIQLLQKEKQAEELKRNFIIAAIIMFSVIAVLILNSQKQRLKFRQQFASQEIAAAKEQLNMFTQNILEKSNLIEKLEQQLTAKQLSAAQQQLIAELTQQTILTEADWDKFKILFEKICPGFFLKLKKRVSDITLAEQRMAALTWLHLETKQIASMLGISAASVNKTKQRLRQRLQLDAEANMEGFLAEMSNE